MESPIAYESANLEKVILVVDDDDSFRELLTEVGEGLGLEVSSASNGVEGLKAFKELRPDLVILDIYMPGMNGITLMHKIKELSPDCPIILITGFLHYEQMIQKDRLKPEGFITKPIDIPRISNLILELLESTDEVAV